MVKSSCSGARLPGAPSLVIATFAVVALIEELAPVTPEVRLAIFSAHSALGGDGRT